MEKKERKDNASAQEYKYNKSPLEKDVPGHISRFLFCWMMPMYYNGMKRDLEEHDLVRAKYQYDSRIVGEHLERKWREEEALAKAEGRAPSLAKVLLRTYWFAFMPGGIYQFVHTMLKTTIPLLFGQLLLFWSVDSNMSRETAAIYAASMILANWVSAFSNHHGNLYCQQFAMKVRVAVSSLMYRKIMRLNSASLGETAAGKVVNILSNDMMRFDLALSFIHFSWIIPIQLAVVCYLGYYQAGISALIGMFTLIIVSMPFQAYLGRRIGQLRLRIADKTDERIKVMTEVISGIQVIKMYAWEIPFQKMVSKRRADEMNQVKIAQRMRTLMFGFMIFTDRTAFFVAILVFTLLGNNMTANVMYPLQQFIHAVQLSLTLMLPLTLSYTAELLASIKRIQQFLCLEDREDLSNGVIPSPSGSIFRQVSLEFELPDKSVSPLSYHKTNECLELSAEKNGPISKSKSVSPPGVDNIIELRNVTASWTRDPNMCALKNISLRIRKGKLCAVIGSVGSGKSSILQLLLREFPASSGTVFIDGTMSYASQEAWLFSSSVRENIIFGLPFDAEKYRKVCKACCLEKDFKQFTFGDQTLVGEKGVSLSGGQRARINLARCIYREADIYLLDDPLSAVDANVGRLLFEGCINGYLRGRTRILVTHQIHFLKAADYIVVLNEGNIENMGTFDELLNSGKEFSTLLASLQEKKDKDKDSINSGGSIEEKAKGLNRGLSVSEEETADEFEAQKMKDEERGSGDLQWSVITAFFKAGGNICFILFTVFLVVMAAGSAGVVDFWVSYWANNVAAYEESIGGAEPETGLDVQVGNFTTAEYLIIHASLILVCIFITNIRVLPFATLCVNASKNLHNFMFSTLIKGIMRFFDTSSSGRILNRFTKDMGAIDEILPRTLLDVLQICSTLVVILVLNAIALYWTLIPSAVLLILFSIMVRIYLKTAQSIKRLEGTTKSPVFGMVTSTLNGISTIRSAGAEKRLIDEFDRHQDLHSAAWNSYVGGGCSFGFYLDTMCLVYLTTVIFVFLYLDVGSFIAVGSVGLAVTQSNTLTAMLQHGARMLVEFIAQLTSVERVLEYTRIETEQNLFEGQIASVPNWPSHGAIEFNNVSMRYVPDEAPVLKNLNFVIESGWKVGIVGRTGAGKSSIISALFRFAYIDGKISIDNIDTSLIAKQELRSKISIIPQEPVLFSATIRYNLDPFNIYSDADIWDALEKVNMKSAVQSLEFRVTEGGANFSVGQRQLLCLARAVLRSNRLLIMDEATANVDPQTDSFIQQTIRQHFKSCTVLTIAHRLNTIMDSDRVLVMCSGEIKEFDHPYILLSDPQSRLSSMIKETGDKNAAVLFQMAQEAFFQSNLKENAC